MCELKNFCGKIVKTQNYTIQNGLLFRGPKSLIYESIGTKPSNIAIYKS